MSKLVFDDSWMENVPISYSEIGEYRDDDDVTARLEDRRREGEKEKQIENAYRYAIYYAPHSDSKVWKAGCEWLGRCPIENVDLTQPTIDGVTVDEMRSLTKTPKRYGFHATLKAPFVLSNTVTFDSLKSAVRDLSQRLKPFVMPRLAVKLHNNLLLYVPEDEQNKNIQNLAKSCVTELHEFAAPLSESEIARRREKGLSKEQDRLLLEWGYPDVFDQYHFHMTLSGSLVGLSDEKIGTIQKQAQLLLNREREVQQEEMLLDHIAIFAEPIKGADFVLVEYFKLGGNESI